MLPLLSGHFVYSVSRDFKLGASLTSLMDVPSRARSAAARIRG